MSRWGLMDGVADLPERAFSENKFTRTFEGGGGGGGGGSSSGTYGPGMTPAQSQALATVSSGTPAPTTPGPTAVAPAAQYTPASFGVVNPMANALTNIGASMMTPVTNMVNQGQAAISGTTAGATTNPMQQAAQAQQAALAGTAGAGTLADTNLAQYQNPYTQQVINAQQQDILRGAQMGLNQLGTAATRAGAFGGSRHGIAMSELGRGAAQLMGQQSAQLRQAGFNQAQAMAQQDIQNRMGQAAQLAGLGQQSFGYGQAINQGLAQQGAQQQALQQALLDAAKGQYMGYQGQPAQSIGYASAALGATPIAQQTQQTRQLGLMDYLTAGATLGRMSDVRLKTNIKITGKLENGLNTYSWDWNEKGQELTGQKSNSGVIAQEVAEMFPEAVITGEHGYMMVDYGHPELAGAI